MRVVVQRVSKASVIVNNETREMGKGLVVLLGIENRDSREDADWLVRKIINMRIFDDEDGVMNRSLIDVEGEVMVISQFTLHARTKKGNRPSYIEAAGHDVAVPLYEYFIDTMGKGMINEVVSGEFGAYMQIDLINDGPVTIFMDTHDKQ